MCKKKRVLLAAFHFPPIQGSSGVFRSLGFARYLPEYDWDVSVLSVHPRAYQEIDERNLALIPPNTRVIRGFALNAQKHLSFRGKYISLFALPDSWQSWVFGGVIKGIFEIYRQSVDVIVSTYPIASAHLIGLILHKLTGRPWIADFRDPMVQGQYPGSPRIRKAFQFIERATFRHAARVIVVSNGTREFYAQKYPNYPRGRIQIIQNGYDESAFDGLNVNERSGKNNGKILLVHSGVMYERERDPSNLFRAISLLQNHDQDVVQNLSFVLRASGNEEKYEQMIRDQNIGEIVALKAPIDYRSALSELLSADALVVCQGAVCDGQIPAKVYEYIYSERPIIGLCSPEGDTGQLLMSIGCPYVAALEDVNEIVECISRFIKDHNDNKVWRPDNSQKSRFSRKTSAECFSRILDEVSTAEKGLA